MAKVVQDEQDPVEPEVLATAIRDLSAAVQRLELSGLNRRAILVLLRDATGLSLKDVGYVLNAMHELERNYCTPRKPR